MTDILTERSGSILRVTLNRPAKKNAMTSSMYVSLAEVFNNAAKDESGNAIAAVGDDAVVAQRGKIVDARQVIDVGVERRRVVAELA